MKFLTFALTLCTLASGSIASDPEERTARMDGWLSGLSTTYHTSGNSGSLAWGEAHLLHTAMSCYLATQDTKWLHFIANHADTIFATAYDVPDWTPYDSSYGDGYLGWGSERYSDQYDEYMVHEGYVCTPIAQFVALVYQDDELWDEFGGQATAHLEFMRRNIAAKWLSVWNENRAPDAEWQINYRQWGGGLDRVPHNQYAAFGNMLLFLHDAAASERHRATHPADDAREYLDRATEMGDYFRAHLVLTGEDAYVWRYHDVSGPEDISHGNIDARFAWDLFAHGVVFDSIDARRFGRTITERLWNQNPDVPRFAKAVDGSGDWEWSDRLAAWSLFAGVAPVVWHVVDAFVDTQPGNERTPVIAATANLERWRGKMGGEVPLRLQHVLGIIAAAETAGERPEVVVNTSGLEPVVRITFPALPEIVRVTATIIDEAGSTVRTITQSRAEGTDQGMEWDCRNADGLPVESGAYRCVVARGAAVDTVDAGLTLTDAQAARRQAAVEEARTGEYRGFPDAWWHAGPFAFDAGEFSAELPPEHEVYVDEHLWHRASSEAPLVDLKKLYGTPAGRFVAYSAVGVDLPSARTVHLRIGRNDYATVWVNGERVYHHEAEGGATLDDDAVAVALPAGHSTVLVKCGDTGGAAWGFYVRILNERGGEVDGLRWTRP